MRKNIELFPQRQNACASQEACDTANKNYTHDDLIGKYFDKVGKRIARFLLKHFNGFYNVNISPGVAGCNNFL